MPSADLPATSAGRDRSCFGRRSALLEILATCALLTGAKTATSRIETPRADKIQLRRVFILKLLRLRRTYT
jgi:hypothetical protein